MPCWLLKTEPESYSFNDLLHEGRTRWDGVRNAQAANNLRAMADGDEVFIYHSGSQKAVVGLARVAGTAYPDPDDPSGRFVAIDVTPLRALTPVTLAILKSTPALANLAIMRQSRLSVAPVSLEERAAILQLAGD